MADFYGCLESTSFRVKDVQAWHDDPDVERLTSHANEDGFLEYEGEYIAFGWHGQYPSTVLTWWDTEGDDEACLDIAEVVQRHIVDGDVCQIGVSGNEKLRYIGGPLAWITSKGVIYFDATVEWGTRLTERDLFKRAHTFHADVVALVGLLPPLAELTGA